jgi:arabinan endo-1,5-alpha-L-arabinosidase
MLIKPVLDQDFPDPDVLKVEDVYYAYATNAKRRRKKQNIQLARSTDLINWEVLPDALPQLPDWADRRFGWAWAPEVMKVADKQYVMYFTVRYPRSKKKGRQCIAVAVSANPEGPFQSTTDRPLISQLEEGGAIDPYVFVDEDGIRYLLWKNDGNACGERTWIYIQRISNDGLSLEDSVTRLLTVDLSWEGDLIEAPTLWKQGGKYYLFYSANAYASSSYAIGYAVADNLLGPYRKSEEPLLRTEPAEGIVGPGGQDITTTPDGRIWLIYHSWSVDGYRSMHLSELVWEGNIPVVKKISR